MFWKIYFPNIFKVKLQFKKKNIGTDNLYAFHFFLKCFSFAQVIEFKSSRVP